MFPPIAGSYPNAHAVASIAQDALQSTTASIQKIWIGFLLFCAALVPGIARAQPAGQPHTITYDHYSLLIDGKRVFIYSGEFHPFRLPSPDLWHDVLEKMKAGGFNTICCYFDWDYHSPKAGVYDFTGIRDLDKFLSLAAEAGLYVIVRPGPYINAETDSGGFPGWLTTIKGRARSTARTGILFLADMKGSMPAFRPTNRSIFRSLPNGILNPNGTNTLAIAVWGEDSSTAGLGEVSLYEYGAYEGGVPVALVNAPGWSGIWGAPGLANDLAVSLAVDKSVIVGGQTVKLSGHVTNAGSASAEKVKVALCVAAGWTVTPSQAIDVPVIPPGQSVSLGWDVQIPSGLAPGQYQLAVVANYVESGVTASTAGTADLQVPYPSVSAAFDNVGITSNSDTNPSPSFLGFDGIGTTYSAEGLTAAGLSPGATVNVGNLSFPWPDVPPAQPDNVLANGQAILVSGQSNQLGFLAASNNAPLSGTGTIYYADGTNSPFELSVSNLWYPAGQNGNPTNTQVAAVNYANYPTGSSGHTIYVFSVSVPLDPTKAVQAVVLPKINGSVAGYQAAMHIFAISP